MQKIVSPALLLVFLFVTSTVKGEEQPGPIAKESNVKAASQANSPQKNASKAPVAQAVNADDESIYVVQRRVYSKSGKIELAPLFFASINNKFTRMMGVGFAAAYHVRENFAVELLTSVPYLMHMTYTQFAFDLREAYGLAPLAVDLKQMNYFGSLSADFSALYGKLEFYGSLIDYDLFLSAGFGIATTLETCNPDDESRCGSDQHQIGLGWRSPSESEDHIKLTGNLGAGLRFFFSDGLGLRIEIRDIVYADRAIDTSDENRAVTTDIANHLLFMAGVAFLL